MPKIKIPGLEVCLNTSIDQKELISNISAAHKAGATTIELCSRLDVDGLSPSESDIRLARQYFPDRTGVMVMVRPTEGDFFASHTMVEKMLDEVRCVADCRADGVVFGLLNKEQNKIDMTYSHQICRVAKDCGLKITFHRAFECVSDLEKGIEDLTELGVNRLLYSGLQWGQPGSALDGIFNLKRITSLINNRFELVIGGGVNRDNLPRILNEIDSAYYPSISFHAHSGAKANGEFSYDSIKHLIDAIIMTG